MFERLLQAIVTWTRERRSSPTQVRRKRYTRPVVEPLETRDLLATLIGQFDTDGDGALETVNRAGDFLQIVDMAGSPRNYFVGAEAELVRIADTNAFAGQEVVFRLGDTVRIVDDRSGAVRNYFAAADALLIAITDTDGRAGPKSYSVTSIRYESCMTRVA